MSDNIKSIISLRRDVKRLKEAVVALGRRGGLGEAPEAVQLDEFSITVQPEVRVLLEPSHNTYNSYRFARRITTYYRLNGLENINDKSSYEISFSLNATQAPNVIAHVTDEYDGYITITGVSEFTLAQTVSLTIRARRLADRATASGSVSFVCSWRSNIEPPDAPPPAVPPTPEPEETPKAVSPEVFIDTTGVIRDTFGGIFKMWVSNPTLTGEVPVGLHAPSYRTTIELLNGLSATSQVLEPRFSFGSRDSNITSFREGTLRADLSSNGRLVIRDEGEYRWQGLKTIPLSVTAYSRIPPLNRRTPNVTVEMEIRVGSYRPIRMPDDPPALEISQGTTYANLYGPKNKLSLTLNRDAPPYGQPTFRRALNGLVDYNVPSSTLSQVSWEIVANWAPEGVLSAWIDSQTVAGLKSYYINVKHATNDLTLPAAGSLIWTRHRAVRNYGGTPPVVSEDAINIGFKFISSAQRRLSGGFNSQPNSYINQIRSRDYPWSYS